MCNQNKTHFMEAFYTAYNINYNVRINNFSINRDMDMENNIYDEFIKKYGVDYIVYHDDEMNHIHGVNSVSTKINFPNIQSKINYINLNKISYTFFDYLTVIQNAKEIHLVDSVWAAFCYQMDAKYGIFSNKPIIVYAKRGHRNLFVTPKLLNNWSIQ
jgi:hypothetical protein